MSTPEQRARWLRVASAVDLNTNATARLAAVAYKEAVPALLDEVERLEQELQPFREWAESQGLPGTERLRQHVAGNAAMTNAAWQIAVEAAEATIARLRLVLEEQPCQCHKTNAMKCSRCRELEEPR